MPQAVSCSHARIGTAIFAIALVVFVLTPRARAQWTAPTPEELSMTSQTGAPGVAAVYLFREELQQDHLHMYSKYARVKVLTEGGKGQANVELKYATGDVSLAVTDIAGRTIHPDGTIIPFTGKPYERTVVKTQGYTIKEKIFTLPDVTVGSILEYRYKLRWEDNYYIAPSWIVQTDLYLRKGHFQWRPTDRQVVSTDERGQLKSRLAWTPILPAGVTVKSSVIPQAAFSEEEGGNIIELNIQDVPASPEEEYMPPIGSLGYRVLFYYSPYQTGAEYWNGEGKHWAKARDKFIGPGPGVGAAVLQIVAAGDTPEQKLKKIYAAVEQLENSDFTREHSRKEDKAAGLSQVHTTDEIWARKRGTSDQITELFIAMARSAGMKAYLMAVTDRDRSLFLPSYLSLDQLDDYVAIVEVNGKEQFFDPGSRYCPYGHVAWKHSDTGGLREMEGSTMLAASSGEDYKASGTNRVANLTMDETGVVSGKIDLKFYGSPALRWRQTALIDDKEAVEREMKEYVEHMLPSNMEVKPVSINKLEQYEEPLAATFSIKGPVGSATGKRLLIIGDLFEENSKPTFVHEKRDQAVCFQYRYNIRDAIRINFPEGFQVESTPAEGSFKLAKQAVYNFKSTTDAKGVTIRRDLYVGEIFYQPAEYPDLRTFYSEFEAKDQEPIILKVAAAAPAGN